MKKMRLVPLLVVALCMFILTGCFGGQKPPETFSISGYVYENGVGVEGVTLSSDVGTTTTDENGYYCFSNLLSGLTITAEKDNYLFVEKNKTFFKGTEEANFEAMEYYNVVGTVKSGDVGVANVKVTATGAKSGFSYSVDNGDFVIYDVAGNVTLIAEKDGYTFFSKQINKNDENIVLNATTGVTGGVEFVGKSQQHKNDVKILLNNEEVDCNVENFSFANIDLNTIIKPVAENMVFEPAQVVVENENQVINFVCKRKYSYTARIVSGGIALSGVTVNYKDTSVQTNEDGIFVINDLLDSVNLTFGYPNFDIKPITIDENSALESDIIATTFVKGSAEFEGFALPQVEISSTNDVTYTNNKGQFVLANVQLGEIVTFEIDGYKLNINNYTVGSSNQNISITAQKIYGVNFSFVTYDNLPLQGVCVSVNGQNYLSDETGKVQIDGLYGEHNVTYSVQGYELGDGVLVSYKNKVFEVFGEPYYSVVGTVYSGSIVLVDAILCVGNDVYEVGEQGEFEVKNLLGKQTITAKCDGYNSFDAYIDYKVNTIDFDLTYDISGKVVSGDCGVYEAKIFGNGKEIFTDRNGSFVIENLKGENTFEIEKEGYNFESNINVVKSSNLTINSSYKIFGVAQNEQLPLSGVKIYLTNYQTGETCFVETNSEGEYCFNEVVGKNILFYTSDNDIKLRPNSYEITQTGEYNFLSSGYELGGCITCGGIGIPDVKVTAGNLTTYTDVEGKYYFALLTSDTTISVEKKGYTFSPNYIAVSSDDDERQDVNFTATYFVEGVISCGDMKVSDVVVKIGDKQTVTDNLGYFKIESLSGSNAIVIEKQGYSFVSKSTISSYEKLEISSTFSISGIVKSGNIVVENATISYNNITTKSDSKGCFTLNGLVSSSTISAEKQGYVFAEEVVNQPKNIEINGTYSIDGYVKSGNEAINGVKVKYNKSEVLTDENGYFAVSGLSGETTFSFEKQGYNFENQTTKMPTTLTVLASYSISGYIKLGDKSLEGVKVSSQGKEALTNEDGYYLLSGISGFGELTIEKEGYSFAGNFEYNGACDLNFTASYKISGYVCSGDIVLSDVKITFGSDEVVTDANGWFEITDITNDIALTFKKTGYKQVEKTYTGYVNDISINMSYSITLNISGVDDVNVLKTFVVTVENGETIQINPTAKVFNISNLYGNAIISIEKQGYLFTPSKFGVENPTTMNIKVSEVYEISGKVIVKGTSVGVGGMIMSLNSSTNITTDNNGAFEFKNIDGTSTISGVLSYNGCKSVSTETIQVTASNAVNKVVTVTMEIDLEDYIYFLFERGYKLLNDASSSYVKVDGVVNLTMGGTQYVGGTRKRDSKGVIFTEKTNYGETTLGIDPKVAVLTYYNTNNGSLKYQQVKAVTKKEDGSGYSVTYGSFTDISLSEYQSLYGIYPYDNYAYTINQSQITSYSGFAKADGLTTFKLTLNANSAAENYKQQMYQLSGQRPAKFNYIYLTYTIDDNGYIRKLDIDEQYVVEVAVVSVTGTGDITETFMIYDKDTKLTDVNLNDIEGSLAYKVANAASNMLDLSCQQINKRRKYEND